VATYTVRTCGTTPFVAVARNGILASFLACEEAKQLICSRKQLGSRQARIPKKINRGAFGLWFENLGVCRSLRVDHTYTYQTHPQHRTRIPHFLFSMFVEIEFPCILFVSSAGSRQFCNNQKDLNAIAGTARHTEILI
jgi:hypothetical protein